MCARPNPPAPDATPVLVLLYGGAPRASLAALAADGARPRVIVLQAPGGSPSDAAEEARALGENLVGQGRLAGFALEELAPGEDWREAANRILPPDAREDARTRRPFLFLLSTAVHPEAGCLCALARRLADEPALAGVSPLLLSPPQAGTPRRVRHMGSVFDSSRELHALYEGLPAGHPLAQKRRFFQVAPDDALMVRLDEFCAAGGFSASLDELAPLDLCFRLGHGRTAFSTEPEARAALHDIHAGLATAACWNSLVQRGRIPPERGRPDYARHVLADGLGYGCTPWLAEGPDLPEAPLESDIWAEAWLAWRRTPEPASLLRLLARSAPEELARLVDLCRGYPALAPHAFAWYGARARHMVAFAEAQDLPQLKEDATLWQRGAARFHHRMLRPGMRALADAGLWACSLDAAASSYDAWLELREPELRPTRRLEAGADWPEIAVLMPVWNPRPDYLAAALDSVLAQRYGRWQLCVADDASTDPAIPQLLRAYAAKDPRIRLVFREKNGHISRATNSALALADAPWTAFFDHDDLLAPTALAEVAAVIAGRPEVRYIYTDEDKIDEDGVRRTPVFKPGFDGDLAAMGHLTTCATALVRDAGGLREGFEGSQDFDFSLRITERLEPRQVAHIPRVLYHWRIHAGSTTGSLATKPYVLEATRRALTESALRHGYAVEGAASEKNNFFKLILGVPAGLTCSVVLLADASGGARAPAPALVAVLGALASVMQVEVLWQPLTMHAAAPYGWPDAMLPPPRPLPVAPHWTDASLAAAREAAGDVLLFLHAGLTPVLDCRPEQMVIHALRPDIALVGGLVWQRGRLWNGGYAPDVTGLPFPLLRGSSPLDLRNRCWGHFLLTRHALGVDWRCMAVRRKPLLEGAPLDAGMGNLAGVDYSLREEAHGRFTLVSPWGQWELLPDAESGPAAPEAEARFLARWGETVRRHPLRNPNLCGAPDYGWRLMLEAGPGPAR
ncbi:MAG: glycosyltransferase [Desulfovibrio sp.]|uniref:glycosyltransferase family 2 protein n=1 Tax=Desulfovibrio sp. TaxID=885 RepID=UPI001A7362CB|nr:glycosyltransferase [Desulfovibrio sp.]MBD5417856.1 glycosyltransferase [Desulfovibrio sp.]